MNTLIFTAHPSQNGFTHTIANQYAGTKKAQNHTVEIINLYDKEWKLDFLSFSEISEEYEDELVFVFPLWWGDAPAILKNMIDIVFSPGFAFEFEKGKMLPQKLLTEKTAKIIITCDAPQLYYWFKGYPFKTIWEDFILDFCGIKLKHFEIFGSMRKRDENSKNKLLEKVTKIALLH